MVPTLTQSLANVKSLAASVQQAIEAKGAEPELVHDNVPKIDLPFTGTISNTPVNASLSIKEKKILELKALFANKNGLEITKKAMLVALKSTSTTGTEGKPFH